jgi:hypothetical protein
MTNTHSSNITLQLGEEINKKAPQNFFEQDLDHNAITTTTITETSNYNPAASTAAFTTTMLEGKNLRVEIVVNILKC